MLNISELGMVSPNSLSSPAKPSVECPAKTVYRTCPRRAFDVNVSQVPFSLPVPFSFPDSVGRAREGIGDGKISRRVGGTPAATKEGSKATTTG